MLEAVILEAMLRAADVPTMRAERERLAPVAAAIATEAASSEIFEGPRGTEAGALLLVAIGRHESEFREEVRRCQRSGDQGRSIGTYQLMGPWAWHGESRTTICADDTLQARLSLRVLGIYRSKCGAATRSMIQAYASGSCGKRSKAAEDIESGFLALLRTRRIVVTGRNARAQAD